MMLYVKKFFVVLFLLISENFLYSSNLTNKNEKVFFCQEKPEGYELILYDMKNKEVFSEIYPNEPWVVNIEDDIWEIGVSTGNPSKYVFYFDREESKFSDTFFNPILLDDKYVAYMKENKLILMDIFGEGILDTKIERNYSKMADPISAIISIEILENGDIQLQYYEGEDMEIILEVIDD